MRRSSFLAGAMAVALLITLVARPADARQRGGRGGAAEITDEMVLDEFDKMVELIWTDDEDDAWGDLDGDDVAGKEAFIAAFWERRDPTPGTEDNEYREIWMGRLGYSARAFGGEGRPGYETDRGKFYLVYGPEPITAEQRKEVAGGAQATPSGDAAGGTGGGGRRGTNIIWTLDPAQNPFLDDKEDVTFAQYQRSYSRITGGIELNEEAFLAGRAVAGYFEARRANPSAGGPARAPASVGEGEEPATTADRIALQELVQSGATRQDLVLKQGMSFIPAQQGNTYSIFNFEVGKQGLTFEGSNPASLKAFGVVFKKDAAATGGEQGVSQIDIPFSVTQNEGNEAETGVHSFGMTLEPGAYRIAWGVIDTASERIATTSYDFDVPSYAGPTLEIPSVIIAASMEEQSDPLDLNTIYEGTRVGNISLGTDLESTFDRNDSMMVLYFIKGLGVDPATQQNRFEIDHRILVAGTEDSIARLPTQELPFGGVQQEIPLAQVEQIEPGTDYEVEIHITDQITGNELIHKVPFTVRGS